MDRSTTVVCCDSVSIDPPEVCNIQVLCLNATYTYASITLTILALVLACRQLQDMTLCGGCLSP
jgi:hypothetical protein